MSLLAVEGESISIIKSGGPAHPLLKALSLSHSTNISG